MKKKPDSKSFDAWLARSLEKDPDLAARVEKRLAEMRIEQDLIALREQRGLTQAQLARLLGISQPAVARMEARGGNLEIRTLVRAAEVLEAHLEIRLIANRIRSGDRLSRAYASGPVAPAFVNDRADEYSSRTTARRKSIQTAAKRRR
jgi:transcriptional regulator with XRE-family HTH domain